MAKDETLKDENTQVFYYLQTLLTKAGLLIISLSGLVLAANLLPFHWVLIYEPHVLLQLCQFWIQLQVKLVNKWLY